MSDNNFDVEAQRGLLEDDRRANGPNSSNLRGGGGLRRRTRYSGFFGYLLSKVEVNPSDDELEMARQIRGLVGVKYDPENQKHEQDLLLFWRMLYGNNVNKSDPNNKIEPIDEKWKSMGFQSKNPSTDFRGGGILSLYSMMYLAERYPEQTRRMIDESCYEKNPKTFYLWACGCINVTMQLIFYLGLNTPDMVFQGTQISVAPVSTRKNVLHVMSSSPSKEARDAFGELFSRAVMKLHQIWLDMCRKDEKITLLNFGQALDKNLVCLKRTCTRSGNYKTIEEFDEMKNQDPDSWDIGVWWDEMTSNVGEGLSSALLWAKNATSREERYDSTDRVMRGSWND